MSISFYQTDRKTHIKVIALAIMFSSLVVMIGLAAPPASQAPSIIAGKVRNAATVVVTADTASALR